MKLQLSVTRQRLRHRFFNQGTGGGNRAFGGFFFLLSFFEFTTFQRSFSAFLRVFKFLGYEIQNLGIKLIIDNAIIKIRQEIELFSVV